MCKMYNISVEDLSYKWQALSYSNTNTVSIFTLKSVPDLKAKLQQDLDKTNATKLTASRVGGIHPFGRGRGASAGVAKVPAAGTLDGNLKIRPLRSSAIKSEVATFSRQSRVVFKGHKSDEASPNRRACEGIDT